MSNKVSYLIQIKDQFSAHAAKIKRGFAGIERKASDAGRSVRGFVRDGEKMKNLSASMAKAGAVMTAAVTVPAILLGRTAIKAASAAQETESKFKAIFGALGQDGPAAVKKLADSYKLAGSTAKELLGSTGAILSATGMDKDRVLELSEALNAASIDLASFHDFQGTAKRGSMILSKALLGEAESLKTMFAITIQQDKGFKDRIAQKQKMLGISEQTAKAEVIFAEIMKQAEGQNALGNFALTQKEYANQVRINTQANIELSESFGKLLLPAATKVVGMMTKLSKRLTELSPTMKGVIVIIAGVVAVLGPMLILLAGIAFAMTVITVAMLVWTGVILAVVAALVALFVYWDELMAFMSNSWEKLWKGFVNFVIKELNAIMKPINMIRELFGKDKIVFEYLLTSEQKQKQFVEGMDKGPLRSLVNDERTPLSSQRLGIDGTIGLSLAPGLKMDKAEMKGKGPLMMLGVNMEETANGQ